MRFLKGLQRTTLPFSYDREMEKMVDNGGAFGALLTDLPKVLIAFCMTLLLPNWNHMVFKYMH